VIDPAGQSLRDLFSAGYFPANRGVDKALSVFYAGKIWGFHFLETLFQKRCEKFVKSA